MKNLKSPSNWRLRCFSFFFNIQRVHRNTLDSNNSCVFLLSLRSDVVKVSLENFLCHWWVAKTYSCNIWQKKKSKTNGCFWGKTNYERSSPLLKNILKDFQATQLLFVFRLQCMPIIDNFKDKEEYKEEKCKQYFHHHLKPTCYFGATSKFLEDLA